MEGDKLQLDQVGGQQWIERICGKVMFAVVSFYPRGERAGGEHLFTQDALDLTIPRDLPPDVRLHSTGTPKPCAPQKSSNLLPPANEVGGR